MYRNSIGALDGVHPHTHLAMQRDYHQSLAVSDRDSAMRDFARAQQGHAGGKTEWNE